MRRPDTCRRSGKSPLVLPSRGGVAAFGNILRHEYDQLDLNILWDVYERDLDPLEAAIDAMLAAHAPKDGSP